ncbi:hypothetical protein HAX54_020960, partial [Datura stramonium]|nr:hypothetical protein [Datura stramonium]
STYNAIFQRWNASMSECAVMMLLSMDVLCCGEGSLMVFFDGSWIGLGQLTWGLDESRNDSWCYPTSHSLSRGPLSVIIAGR